MSIFRKTMLTTAVLGAGLVSTSGAAFAHESHDSHDETINSCTNIFNGGVDNSGATQEGGINGAQGVIQGNILCDAVKNNGNGNFSGNSMTLNLLPPAEEGTEPVDPSEGGEIEGATPANPTEPSTSDVTTQQIQ